MIPFLLDMARLYERFVAEWLKRHITSRFSVKAQERHNIDVDSSLHFDIDLVLADWRTGAVRWVMDTKYKAAPQPSTADIAQIVAYVEAKGCRDGVLIYPVPLQYPLDQYIGSIRVRSLTFAIDGDLEQAGQKFLERLGSVRLPAEAPGSTAVGADRFSAH